MSRRRTLRLGVLTAGALVGSGVLTACGAPGPEASMTYGQRLMANFNLVHDPCMVKEGDYYYVYSTGQPAVGNGNIQMRVSTDLRNWVYIGTAFQDIPNWIQARIPGIPNLWAPDLSYYRGRYQLYYACSTFGTKDSFIALATNATLDPNAKDYHWVDEGMVISSEAQSSYNAIDPNFVEDAQGNPWLDFGSYNSGIKLFRLNPHTGKAEQSPPQLGSLAYRPLPPNDLEAPFITYRKPHYYLFTSFGKCCAGVQSTYRIMVGRSPAINGPYADATGTPMIVGGGSLVLGNEGSMIGPGGQSICRAGKGEYLVYHYYDALDGGAPHLQIREVQWSAAGWPQVGAPMVPVPNGSAGSATN